MFAPTTKAAVRDDLEKLAGFTGTATIKMRDDESVRRGQITGLKLHRNLLEIQIDGTDTANGNYAIFPGNITSVKDDGRTVVINTSAIVGDEIVLERN